MSDDALETNKLIFTNIVGMGGGGRFMQKSKDTRETYLKTNHSNPRRF